MNRLFFQYLADENLPHSINLLTKVLRNAKETLKIQSGIVNEVNFIEVKLVSVKKELGSMK